MFSLIELSCSPTGIQFAPFVVGNIELPTPKAGSRFIVGSSESLRVNVVYQCQHAAALFFFMPNLERGACQQLGSFLECLLMQRRTTSMSCQFVSALWNTLWASFPDTRWVDLDLSMLHSELCQRNLLASVCGLLTYILLRARKIQKTTLGELAKSPASVFSGSCCWGSGDGWVP